MTALSLSAATTLYRNAADCAVRRHRVDCPPFSNYVRALEGLKATVRPHAEDEYWRQVMWRAHRYMYDACSAPLPFNSPALRGEQILGELSQHLRNCDQIYRDCATAVLDLLTSLGVLVDLDLNPQLEAILAVLGGSAERGAAVVMNRSRLIQPAAEEIARHESLSPRAVLHESELRGASQHTRLVVIGASSWYSPAVLSAPRAPAVDVVRYRFVRDKWREPELFGGTWGRRRINVVPETDGNDQEAIEIAPTVVDTGRLVQRLVGGTPTDHQPDVTPAKLVLLDGEQAVLLGAHEGSWALVIDLDRGEDQRVRRLPVVEIEPGMFVLLRSHGGGDYIVPLADRMLGREAVTAREAQRRWKAALRKSVMATSAAAVADAMRPLCRVAVDHTDVLRWLSEDSIRTRYLSDFAAIMRFIGLEGETSRIWSLMGAIHAAHSRAGKEIQQQLLDRVADADLARLRKLGTMVFDLPGEDVGSLTAYRVEQIRPGTVTVARSHLSRPFHRETLAWRE